MPSAGATAAASAGDSEAGGASGGGIAAVIAAAIGCAVAEPCLEWLVTCKDSDMKSATCPAKASRTDNG